VVVSRNTQGMEQNIDIWNTKIMFQFPKKYWRIPTQSEEMIWDFLLDFYIYEQFVAVDKFSLCFVVSTKEALYTRRETAVCICPSSGGESFEYTT
jgi:hypothetical protein